MTGAIRPEPRWVDPEPVSEADVAALHGALGLPLLVCRILVRRGYADEESVRSYLRPHLESLPPPGLLPDMMAAVGRIERALETGETILVHGDFDVDGMAGAALLARGLRALGGEVEAFVPDRLVDGYDLGPAGLRRAREVRAGLIVTVDCGMTAVEAVEEATRDGFDVIVTDHHRPAVRQPPALAVVNPQRADSEYPFDGLSGVGVAFKLLAALYTHVGRPSADLNPHLDLVALGTIADRAPLIGENRVLVKAGLRVLAHTRNAGLRALMAIARLQPLGGRVSEEDAAFQLAPRLNAAGRMGAAKEGLLLLVTEDPSEAEALARRLDSLNRQRRLTDQRVLAEAEAQLDEPRHAEGHAAVVLSSDAWHPGVIGIVASRLAERLGRPAVLIAFDDDRGRGSARSAGGVNLIRALDECAPLLERYGGHRQAAGFDVRRENLAEFSARFVQTVARINEERSAGDAASEGGDAVDGGDIVIDLSLTIREAAEAMPRWMRYLEPFGDANPRPIFRAGNVELAGVSRVGADGGHLRAVVVGEEGGRLDAIGFGMGGRADDMGRGRWEVAFELVEDTWRNRNRVQARLLDARPT